MNEELVTLILLNTGAWAVIHLSFAWGGTNLPLSWFDPESWLFRPRRWEGRGKVYQCLFRVKSWKNAIPDGARWFRGGFPKADLAHRDARYLEQFASETCRGEFVHWMVFLSSGLFFLWNPGSVGIVMVVYAALANMPCVIIQRYNRPRLLHAIDIQAKHGARLGAAPPSP